MKSKIQGLVPMGNSVYQDDRGRLYLADRKNRILYMLNRDEQKKLPLYQQRYLIGVIFAILAGYYVNWYVGIGGGIVIGFVGPRSFSALILSQIAF